MVLFLSDGAACGTSIDSAFFHRGELLMHFAHHVYPIEIALAIVFGATCVCFLIHLVRLVPLVRHAFSASAGAWVATAIYAGFWVNHPALGVIFLALAAAATTFAYYEVTDW